MKEALKIRLAKTAEDIVKCTRVLLELRPHHSPEILVPMVLEMFGEGYHLAFIEENGEAVSAVGYRYLQFLFCGKHFYIDDLVTLPEFRGNGYAGALLNFVEDHARAEGFGCIALDSGHQRHTAHRLYLNKGYDIVAHHFIKKI
ncbi:MAG: GNAT family N-acetyltransferase [Saprospiraceae bacterium]